MMPEREKMTELKRYVVDCKNLPENFPTHGHGGEFWEASGRAVATFGFLEEILGKAIFAFTATREIPEDEIQAEFEKWVPTLQRALSDPLGGLIDTYDDAVRNNNAATIENLDSLLDRLREAATLRNVICHGSWRPPDEQLRQHIVELICNVINTVTHMGWQFPGSSGSGNPIV